jgi:hypothetical protein
MIPSTTLKRAMLSRLPEHVRIELRPLIVGKIEQLSVEALARMLAFCDKSKEVQHAER